MDSYEQDRSPVRQTEPLYTREQKPSEVTQRKFRETARRPDCAEKSFQFLVTKGLQRLSNAEQFKHPSEFKHVRAFFPKQKN